MAYDPAKDVVLWRAQDNVDGTFIEIKSYDGGEAKVCLTKNSNYGIKPVYRFSSQDFAYIGANWNNIKSIMQQFNASLPQRQ